MKDETFQIPDVSDKVEAALEEAIGHRVAYVLMIADPVIERCALESNLDPDAATSLIVSYLRARGDLDEMRQRMKPSQRH